MRAPLSNPVNEVQRQFVHLCQLGGGRNGGPARTKVQELLHKAGARLNAIGRKEVQHCLEVFADRNPWHVCFAVGVAWGHLAKLDDTFVEAAVNLLEEWNDEDLRVARQFHYERGPEPITQSLVGGHEMFQRVRLPQELSETLEQYRRAQERWFGQIIGGSRPPYIGAWNATAMFMIALFSDYILSQQLTTTKVMLPHGGPIHTGLSILYQSHVISRKPSGGSLDDEAFEPGVIYENNALFEELLKGHAGWNLLDVHSGIYMLGTRLPQSNDWF